MADIVYSGQVAGGPLNSGALPANYDLVLYKGDYLRMVLTITDGSNTPMDLSLAVPKAQLKSDYSDRAPQEFTCTVVDEGQVEVFMPSTTTSQLLPGSYIWDFQITYSEDEVRTYLAGDVTVYDEVTT